VIFGQVSAENSPAPWLADTKFMSPQLPDETMKFYRRHLHAPELTVPQLLLIMTMEIWQHFTKLYFSRYGDQSSKAGRYAQLAIKDLLGCINKGLIYRHMEAVMSSSLRSHVLLDRALAMLNILLPTKVYAGVCLSTSCSCHSTIVCSNFIHSFQQCSINSFSFILYSTGASVHHEFVPVLLALCTTLRVDGDYHHPSAVPLRFSAVNALQGLIRCQEISPENRAKFEFTKIAKVSGMMGWWWWPDGA
jgi:hypothetical protein